MVKKLLSVAMSMAVVFGASAQEAASAQQPQQPQLHQLPLNPKVKTGVLPNGLHY